MEHIETQSRGMMRQEMINCIKICAHGLVERLGENPILGQHLLVSGVSVFASPSRCICAANHRLHIELLPQFFLCEGLWRRCLSASGWIPRGDGLSQLGVPLEVGLPIEVRPLALVEVYDADDCPISLFFLLLVLLQPSPQLPLNVAWLHRGHSLLDKPGPPCGNSGGIACEDSAGMLRPMSH